MRAKLWHTLIPAGALALAACDPEPPEPDPDPQADVTEIAPAPDDTADEEITGFQGPLPPLNEDPTLSPRAAAARHGVFRMDTRQQLIQRWRQSSAADMRLVDLDVYPRDGGAHYYATFEPGSSSYGLYYYTSESAFLERVKQETAAERQLVDVEIATIDGTTWYYGVWQGASTTPRQLTQSASLRDLERLHDARLLDGDRLVDVEITDDGRAGTTYWAVWKTDAEAPKQQLLHGDSLTELGDAYEAARGDGWRLQDLAGVHRADDSQEYLGIADAIGGAWAYYVYTDWTDAKEQWASQGQAGRSLRDLEVIERPDGGRYHIGTYGVGPEDPTDRTDTEQMAAEIHDLLFDEVVGYSYAIADHSQLAIAGAGGAAQRSPDPFEPMTSKTYSTLASVTKHLTGVATLALLERNGLTMDTEVVPDLPADWDPMASMDGLTYGHLLTHTSGFNQLLTTTDVPGAGNDWDGLKVMVEQIGADPGSSRQYKNANFATLRILTPRLWQELEGEDVVPDVTIDNVRELYLGWLDELAFERLGLPAISCETPDDEVQALSYDLDDDTKAGKSWGGTTNGCGGHAGLHMTAQQLATFLTGVRYGEGVLSTESLDLMDEERAGWSHSGPADGGAYYRHAGQYGSNGRQTNTCVIRLPDGIDASIIINSHTPIAPCTVLRNAYNAATP